MVFNTPHHRVHHGANPEYIDKNYGNLLIIWDKMFELLFERNPVTFGLVNVNTLTLQNNLGGLDLIFKDMKNSGSYRIL